MTSSPPERRSPLKSRPLRQAGESVQDEILRVVDDDLATYLLVAVVFVLLAALEWLRLYLGNPKLHWHYTVIAIGAVVLAIWRRERLRNKVTQLRLGRDGERAVGQFLERMRERGYRVFHDIQQDHFNIDHVLVGPEGVYAIETKNAKLPETRRADRQLRWRAGASGRLGTGPRLHRPGQEAGVCRS